MERLLTEAGFPRLMVERIHFLARNSVQFCLKSVEVASESQVTDVRFEPTEVKVFPSEVKSDLSTCS
jgi:hypothetical protein